jgi:hypothetical protein
VPQTPPVCIRGGISGKKKPGRKRPGQFAGMAGNHLPEGNRCA